MLDSDHNIELSIALLNGDLET